MSTGITPDMTRKSLLPAFIIALALLLPLGLMARANGENATTDIPAIDQTATSKLVFNLLSGSQYAYRPRPLDAAMSAEIFDNYLKALDSNKQYFDANDIERFASWRVEIGQHLRSGTLGPEHDIFALYKERVAERVQWIRDLLNEDIFDFSSDERWYYDRKDADWAANQAELDALWRQIVRNDWLRLKLADKEPDVIRKTLDKRYLNMGKSIAALNEEDAFSSLINAYTATVDPHTSYQNPRQAKLFNQRMALTLDGIGAVLQKQDDVVVIRELYAGGPAALSEKFKVGDRIVGVGQGEGGPIEEVLSLRLEDVVEKIKGTRGTKVRLNVIPAEANLDSEPVCITLTRAQIRMEAQLATSEVITIPASDERPERRIGVIKLPTFYQDHSSGRGKGGSLRSSATDVAELLEKFKHDDIGGVVVDLRNNGGGPLTDAINLTGLFIDRGVVVQVRESGGRVSVLEKNRNARPVWDGPLAVLINRGSASASEIFAGAIQDYGRGIVIGETSFGKGTVQNLFSLDRLVDNDIPRLGQIKITTSQFFLPDGSSTQNRGVVPDIAFPMTVDASEYGESTYDNALPWTRIAAAQHTRYGDFSRLIPQLERLHASRSGSDLEFRWWVEDVNEFRAERERKYISLNENERRAERDRQRERNATRQAERKRLGLILDPFANDDDDGLWAGERNVVEQAAREEEAKKRPDALLREASAILADAVDLLAADHALAAEVLPLAEAPGSWLR